MPIETSPVETNSYVNAAIQWDQIFKALVASVALIAFCIQPVIPFIDPDKFMGGAGFLAGSIMWCYIDVTRRGVSWWTVPGIIVGLIGIWALATATTAAGHQSRVNDVRCETIERDMLSADPKINDGATLFQALHCRPQTTANITVPKHHQIK